MEKWAEYQGGYPTASPTEMHQGNFLEILFFHLQPPAGCIFLNLIFLSQHRPLHRIWSHSISFWEPYLADRQSPKLLYIISFEHSVRLEIIISIYLKIKKYKKASRFLAFIYVCVPRNANLSMTWHAGG